MFKKHRPFFNQLWTLGYGVTFLSKITSAFRQIFKFQDINKIETQGDLILQFLTPGKHEEIWL